MHNDCLFLRLYYLVIIYYIFNNSRSVSMLTFFILNNRLYIYMVWAREIPILIILKHKMYIGSHVVKTVKNSFIWWGHERYTYTTIMHNEFFLKESFIKSYMEGNKINVVIYSDVRNDEDTLYIYNFKICI